MGSERVERIFATLEHLQGSSTGLTLTDLGSRLGLAPSSAHDLLTGLLASKVVVREGSHYRLGPRTIGLAVSIVASLDLFATARQDAAELSERTSEDVLLAFRAGDTITYGVRHEGTTPLKVNVGLGQPRPLHASSAGKLFAAYHEDLRQLVLDPRTELVAFTPKTNTDRRRLAENLAAIRELGLALSHEEAIAGVLGIAAPVFDREGKLVLGIHVSLPIQRATSTHLATVLAETLDAAARTTTRLGGSPERPPAEVLSRILEYLELAQPSLFAPAEGGEPGVSDSRSTGRTPARP